MLYQSFTLPSEAAIIGVRDGLDQVEIHPSGFRNQADYDAIMDFFSYQNYWARTDHTPPQSFVFEYVKLRPRAKLTDVLQFRPFLMGCPFMLNARAKAVFAAHCIQPGYFFDTYLHDKSGLISDEYSLYYSPNQDYEVIDFARSRFRVNAGLPNNPQWQHYTLPSLEAYNAFGNTLRSSTSLEVESLVMSEKFDANLDFFKCRIGGMFMSDRLKEAVEAAGLTGLEFHGEKSRTYAFAG